MLKNFETRKFMAILFAVAYVVFTGVAIFTGRSLPETFITLVATVVAYYFGKSTALDGAKEAETIIETEEKDNVDKGSK